MNIFFTSICPVECAAYLDDKRVVKMVLETAQMLSTAIRSTGLEIGYKSTHANHQCNVWVRKSRQNFMWLYEHGLALATEYTFRFDKVHKSEKIIKELGQYSSRLPSVGMTVIPNCAANKDKGIDYKHMDNTYIAYQLYLNDRWDTDKKLPTFGGRG